MEVSQRAVELYMSYREVQGMVWTESAFHETRVAVLEWFYYASASHPRDEIRRNDCSVTKNRPSAWHVCCYTHVKLVWIL